MCSNCENCKLLVKQDQDRIEWAKDLSLKNIQLHKKVSEQHDLIMMLKMKLMQKRISSVSEYIRSGSDPAALESDDDDETSVEEEEDYFEASSTVSQEALKEKIDEINLLLEFMSAEREHFQRDMEEHERHVTGTISYLNGEIEHFRESLFTEMRKSNSLKGMYNQAILNISDRSNEVVIKILREEIQRISNELRSRYRDTIQKSKEETERQTKLVAKLRKHNKQLYLHIQKTKNENAAKVAYLEKIVQDLKKTAKQLREKNENLHKQIKLEVEGCQNDIQDARKKIRKLTNPQN